jgi:hypothetical protein
MSSLTAVITTIQPPTPSVSALVARLSAIGAGLIAVGDRKGPPEYALPGTQFLSLANQLESGFSLASQLPVGHYARKNIGYLQAIRAGAEGIYETDDDNAPLPEWGIRTAEVSAREVAHRGWVNAFRHFTSEPIWPRGFPLDEIMRSYRNPTETRAPSMVRSSIQQGLANNSPDVDAIWRLTADRPFSFSAGDSIVLPRGSWCPFNSQSTWWWREAFPLMYLPSHCSFRMTDIWRSFIAQRCLWELGQGVVFHAAEVLQERNEHDLMRDFNDEVPGYQRNRELVRVLDELSLEAGPAAVADNLRRCYAALVAAGFFAEQELQLVAAWCADLERIA